MGHHCCNKQKVKRGLWSPEEDEKLLSHITLHGHDSWSSIPKLAGLQRCGKSCRLRWINYLRPDLKRGIFTDDEERTIIEVHRILGNRWSQIAKHLPGRTDNEVKNFWNSCIRKKLLAQGFDPNTHNLLPSNQKKIKISNNASSKPSNHYRISSNSSSLVFSDDYDSQTGFSSNEIKEQNTINFENHANYTQLDNKAQVSEFPTQLLASSNMNVSNCISSDVNPCEYIIDENTIWNTTPNLESYEQSEQTTQVMEAPEEIIDGGENLDASLFDMLMNYGLGDYNADILPSSEVYGDIDSTMEQVDLCEGINFHSGFYSI